MKRSNQVTSLQEDTWVNLVSMYYTSEFYCPELLKMFQRIFHSDNNNILKRQSELVFPPAHIVSNPKRMWPVCRNVFIVWGLGRRARQGWRGSSLYISTWALSRPPPRLLCTSQNRPGWQAWLHSAHLSVSKAIIIPPGKVVNPLLWLTGAGQF